MNNENTILAALTYFTVLTAELTNAGWCVTDAEGNVWCPDPEAEREIKLAPNPGQQARIICHAQPDRGAWCYLPRAPNRTGLDGVPANLTATLTSAGWCVRDNEGGVWWPDTLAEREIALAQDPGRRARVMCHTEPSRGEWCY